MAAGQLHEPKHALHMITEHEIFKGSCVIGITSSDPENHIYFTTGQINSLNGLITKIEV